jgi:F-type H+-transporting ATPase subunit b
MILNLLLAFQEHSGAGEHAAGHGAADPAVLDIGNWLPGITALVVFAIAFAVLALKVWPQITKGLDDREKKIRDEIAAAEAAREQAKAALSEYQRNLAQARDEAAAMIAKAKNDAKAVADDLRTRNQAELVEMKTRATKEIESAKQAAIGAIYNEASNLAVSIAGKILQREINDRDQKHLVDESLKELARSGRS